MIFLRSSSRRLLRNVAREKRAQYERAYKIAGKKRPRLTASTQRTARELVSREATLDDLRHAASSCKACDLWKSATQTVFGEGASHASIMLVGEQPGDQEDQAGRPFVGPAGRLLDQAMAEAGIERTRVYVTNVVKHFKWSPAERGKRRIHKKPRGSEIHACRPWFDRELELVRPRVLVCLGASAAQALLGKDFLVSRERGKPIESRFARYVIATVHPSSILRAPDDESRPAQMRSFVQDLEQAALLVKRKSRSDLTKGPDVPGLLRDEYSR